MNTMPRPALPSPEEIRRQIAQLLPEQDSAIRDTDNLLERGLDSLLLMRLIGTWRRAGADVTFARLIEAPTMTDWLALLGAAKPVAPVAVTVDDGPFDLSDVQYAYWIGRRDDQPLGGVGCHAYLELDGAGIDPARLHSAWSRLVAHHPMLRAAFDEDGRQRILPFVAPALPVHDLTALAPDAVQSALAVTRAQLDHRRLDVATGQVAGLELSLLPNGATRIHVDIDLLVADVQSLSILMRDLAAAYDRDAVPAAPKDWSFAAHLEAQKARSTTRWPISPTSCFCVPTFAPAVLPRAHPSSAPVAYRHGAHRIFRRAGPTRHRGAAPDDRRNGSGGVRVQPRLAAGRCGYGAGAGADGAHDFPNAGAVLEHAELRSLLVPRIRADFQLIETYSSNIGPKLDTPVSAFIGTGDSEATPDEAALWADITKGPFRLNSYAGNHFYLTDRPAPLIRDLTERLSASVWPCTP